MQGTVTGQLGSKEITSKKNGKSYTLYTVQVEKSDSEIVEATTFDRLLEGDSVDLTFNSQYSQYTAKKSESHNTTQASANNDEVLAALRKFWKHNDERFDALEKKLVAPKAEPAAPMSDPEQSHAAAQAKRDYSQLGKSTVVTDTFPESEPINLDDIPF